MNGYKVLSFLCFVGLAVGVLFLDWPPDLTAFLALSSFIFNVRGAQEQLEGKVDELLGIMKETSNV